MSAVCGCMCHMGGVMKVQHLAPCCSASVFRNEVRFDLANHLYRQREWSERTFGPSSREKGVIDHITKELVEVADAAEGEKLPEWIDVVILALDGAWRSGATPEQIIEALVTKQGRNEARTWPDWTTAPPDQAIEHDRTEES